MEFDLDSLEYYIIKSLINVDIFMKTFASSLVPSLFAYQNQKIVSSILAFYKKYYRSPTHKIIHDALLPKIITDEAILEKTRETLDSIMMMEFDCQQNYEWLVDEAKKFVKHRTILNAVYKSVEKLDKKDHDSVVEIMENAFKISFDESMGLDYYEDLEERLKRCKVSVETFDTGLKSLNDAIGGGYRKKALFVVAAPANTGKTLVLNDAATTLSFQGQKVLYISLELAEDYIAQRTDAKFAAVPISSIKDNPEFAIKKAIQLRDHKKGSLGTIIYKEYAPNAISTNDLRAYIKQLEIKKSFKPDFIIVDYLKLIRPNGKTFADNTYGKIVTVCEELRSLAMEYNCGVLTAAQTGRQSFNSKEIGMQDVSDSIGIAQTADVLITLNRPKDLEAENIANVCVAKSRFSKNNQNFHVKIDFEYMKLVDMKTSESLYMNNNKKGGFKSNAKEEGDDNYESEDSQAFDL